MGSVAYLDARNGFRDVKFGTSVSQYKGMVLAEASGSLNTYTRPTDDLSLGQAHLEHIYYAFYKDRLSTILIETKGAANSRAALAVLQQAYGAGRKPNQFLEKYFWNGQKINLLYNEKISTRDAAITFVDFRLVMEHQKDNERDAKKAASGL